LLKLKFQGLHWTVVDSVNPAGIIGLLFQKAVLGRKDVRVLQREKKNPQQQCHNLLVRLHSSENPLAFVHLYHTIKNEPHLQWLIEQIDNYSTGNMYLKMHNKPTTFLVRLQPVYDKIGV